MSHIEMIKDVPNAKVAEVKASYQNEGATSVLVCDQGGGLSTVVATFPDPPASDTAQKAAAQGATIV
jgi:hypothetical protein